MLFAHKRSRREKEALLPLGPDQLLLLSKLSLMQSGWSFEIDLMLPEDQDPHRLSLSLIIAVITARDDENILLVSNDT